MAQYAVVPALHRALAAQAAGETAATAVHLAAAVALITSVAGAKRVTVKDRSGHGRWCAARALPLIACHTVVTLFVAGFFGLNRYLAVAAGNLCMPPLVPALCIEVGYYLRHGRWLTDISLETLGAQALERVYEWFLGSLLVGPLLAAVAGGLVYVVAVMLLGDMGKAVKDACSEHVES